VCSSDLRQLLLHAGPAAPAPVRRGPRDAHRNQVPGRSGPGAGRGTGRPQRLRSGDATARFTDHGPQPVAVQRVGAAEGAGDAAAANQGAVGLGITIGALVAVASRDCPCPVHGTGVASSIRAGTKPAKRLRRRGRPRGEVQRRASGRASRSRWCESRSVWRTWKTFSAICSRRWRPEPAFGRRR